MKRNILLNGVLGFMAVMLVATYIFGSDGGTFKGSFNPQLIRQQSYSVDTTNVQFLPTVLGATSRSHVTVTNNSLHPMNFSWQRLPQLPVFTVVDRSPFVIPANSSRQLTFEFTPVENATLRLTESVVLSADGKNTTLILSGEGVAAYSVSTASVDFGPTHIGTWASRGVTIQNNTGNTIHFRWRGFENINTPTPAFIVVGGTHDFDVPARQTHFIQFSFRPFELRDHNFYPSLEGAGFGRGIHLSGSGIPSYTVTRDVQFLRTFVGASSRAWFTVRNTSDARLSFSVGNPRSASFRLVSDRNFSLRPGASTDVIFSFTPVRGGIVFNELEDDILWSNEVYQGTDVTFHATSLAR